MAISRVSQSKLVYTNVNPSLGSISISGGTNPYTISSSASIVPASATILSDSYTYTSAGKTYKVHIFTSSASATVNTPGFCDVLLVGGGGGGSRVDSNSGGGGGGGGHLEIANAYLSTGTLTVTVGAGGATSDTVNLPGYYGGTSRLGSIYSPGGSGGGGRSSMNNGPAASGGGGAGSDNAGMVTGGTGTSGIGNNGGNGVHTGGGGGGGGAGATGSMLLETSAVQAGRGRPTHTQGPASQEQAAVGARLAYPVQVAQAGLVAEVKVLMQAPITLPLGRQTQVAVAAVP